MRLIITVLLAASFAMFLFVAAVWWFERFPAAACDAACRQQRTRQWEWRNRAR
jgi:hypothetical protein